MKDLDTLRQEIDAIDDQIVELISRRFKTTQTIGHLKAQDSLPVVDRNREKQIIARLAEKSESLSLNPDLIQSIFTSILSEAVSQHHDHREEGSSPGHKF